MNRIAILLALLVGCSSPLSELNYCTWRDTGDSYTAMPGQCAKVCTELGGTYAVAYEWEDYCEGNAWECILLAGGETAVVVEDWKKKPQSGNPITIEIFACEDWESKKE